jgi:putative transposase
VKGEGPDAQTGRAAMEALNEALARFGAPEIMNTDQGSQFTSWAWTTRLMQAGVKISMDGKGRFLDNIFVERLWRSLKYQCVYLHAWSGGREARAGIGKWMDLYNQRRAHSALGGRTPYAVYWSKEDQEQPDWQARGVA